MESALKNIFDDLNQKIITKLKEEPNRFDLDLAAQLRSNTVEFPINIDANGNCHYEAEEHGHGITIKCILWFESPDTNFEITIKSSDGGGGNWRNVHINQRLEFKVETSFWHKTKVTVDAHANVINEIGRGKIEYSF